MRDLDTADRLRARSSDAPALLDDLRALARLPMDVRWPFFAVIEPHTRDPNPTLRAAALTALHGAHGLPAVRRFVELLDAEEPEVATAAREGFAEVTEREPLRAVHALYHPAPDVRAFALAHLPARLAQTIWLPLLADADSGPAAREILDRRGLDPAAVATLVELALAERVDVDWALGLLAGLEWRRCWAQVINSFGDARTAQSLDGVEAAALLAKPDRFDRLCLLIGRSALRGSDPALQVLDAWLELALGAPLHWEWRLLTSLLAVSSLLGALPPAANALAALGRATHLAPEGGLDAAACRAALRRLAGLHDRPHAEPVPATLRGEVLRVGGSVDLAAAAGLCALLDERGLGQVLDLVSVAEVAAAMVGDPVHGALLLKGPLRTRSERSLRRRVLRKLTATHGPDSLGLWDALVRVVPRDELTLLGVVAKVDSRLFSGLVERLDAALPVPRRRDSIAAGLAAAAGIELANALLDRPVDGPIARAVVAASLKALDEARLKLWAHRVTPTMRAHLIAADADEPFLPWAVQETLLAVWRHTDKSVAPDWGAKVAEPAELPTPTKVRTLKTGERTRIAVAPSVDLVAALAPCLLGPVRGVAAALGRRTDPRPLPEATVALLLCADPDALVDAELARWGGSGPRFRSEVDRLVAERYAHAEAPSMRLSVWLWRWDKPRLRFRDWVASVPDASAVIVWMLGLPWPPLRWSGLRALRHVIGSARFHDAALFELVAKEPLIDLLVALLEPPPTPPAGSPRGAWPSDLVDQDNTATAAAETLARLHAGGADLSGVRSRVMAVLGGLPNDARRALTAWLDTRVEVVRAVAAVEWDEVHDDIAALTDIPRLAELARHGRGGVVELATLRMLDLGDEGESALVEALWHDDTVHTDLVSQALAMTESPTVCARLEGVLRGHAVPRVRFYAGLALLELGRGELDRTVQALCAAGPSWARDADVRRLLDCGATLGSLALQLIEAPHYAVYYRALTWFLERPGARDRAAALEAFLRAGNDRAQALRTSAALALRSDHRDSVGMPIIASVMLRSSNRRGHGQSWWAHHASVAAVEEVVRSSLLAGDAWVLMGTLIDGLLEPKTQLPAREAGAMAILAESTRPDVQRRAFAALPPRPERSRKLLRLAQLVVWGREQSRILLGRTLGVRTIGSEELGWTRLKSSAIYINPLPLLKGERSGEAIVRGLMVHELGHHRYNADADGLRIWDEAAKLRLQRLHNLVCDEHLERNLRSLDTRWGDDLKRLGAWAFQHATRPIPVEDLVARLGANAAAVMIGTPLIVVRERKAVGIGLGALLRAIEAQGSSFGRFFRALRMGLGNRWDDPQVGEALALFGKRFRGLDNEGLWTVTQELARIFGGDTQLLDVADLHGTARGEEGEVLDKCEGISDGEVQAKADELEREVRERDKSDSSDDPHATRTLNLGSELTFDPIDAVERLAPDPAGHAVLAREVSRPARRLRQVLASLGLTWEPVRPRVRGHRLDRSRLLALAVRGDPRVLVARKKVVRADLFVGVVMDCSGSMRGERMDRARHFAALLVEACRGLKGVDLRVFGFTHTVIYDAGDADRPAVSRLEAGGGNNDAAALLHVAGVAQQSRRSARLLVMISDGLPTECTVDALRGLVRTLVRRQNMACAQIAVAPIDNPCFDHYVEVSLGDTDEATRRFGRIVAGLVASTLRG